MVIPKPREPGDTGLEDQAQAEADRIAAMMSNTLPAGTIQLPEGYTPPARTAITTTVAGPTGTRPLVTTFTGRGLIDENGRVERDPNGAVREQYRDDEIRYEWYQLPFNVRQQYVDRFKQIGIIGKNQKLDPNLVGNVELQAFSTVLSSANVEGRTWRAVLPIIASRAKALGLGQDGGSKWKPTSIADIERAIQTQAQEELGRELQVSEAGPLAARVQRQEARQRAKTAEQPTSTQTLIEQNVAKQYGAESDAYRAVQYIDRILKS